ncbi:hypothetical protein CGLO_14470 [Colletotrichum gloeosporioides Cg-14]|uniref:Uncharacterized protein n=1 Tax=Colletotrichum gloeosporioides (strain Cg-14) TaxID=1237896 RepID=T0K3Y5_COLGC|nr:hypothetical protein CGLO_14470 [Colletotrichum gloeosporioides Cg-14]
MLRCTDVHQGSIYTE